MWELDLKEGWATKNWCFQTVVLEKTLESLSDSQEIQPVNSKKGNQFWISIGRTDVEAEALILWPFDSKIWLIGEDWCWEKLKAKGEVGIRGWDAYIASLTQWTGVWENSKRQWRTEEPGDPHGTAKSQTLLDSNIEIPMPQNTSILIVHFHRFYFVERLIQLLLLLSHFSWVRLCDPMDGSPPGSSVPGILQARTLDWVAISFFNACMHAKLLQMCPTLCDPKDSSPPGCSVHRIL